VNETFLAPFRDALAPFRDAIYSPAGGRRLKGFPVTSPERVAGAAAALTRFRAGPHCQGRWLRFAAGQR
jgi:hypothetical protein